MNKYEKNMFDLLKDLKENHHVKGIKISFEDEGLTGELSQIIASIAYKAGVAVSMKIGGCEARRDMHDAKVLGVNKIVAPMVETPYALKKFVEASHVIYSEEEYADTKFMVNIETITGFNNLEAMLQIKEAQDIYGIVLGRVDFSGSMGKDRSFVNSEEMMSYAEKMALLAQKYNKKLFVGGGVSGESLNFFHKLPKEVLECFETRNIIFDAQYSLADVKIEQALTKAMGFELNWMQCKKEFYSRLANSETKRIAMIEERYNKQKAQ